MEKCLWKGYIKEGCVDEYVKRHMNIWPELKDVLYKAGICNYSIWLNGNEVYGYYECRMGLEYAQKYQAQSEVVDRWNEYMKDILYMEFNPDTGAQQTLKEVFYWNRSV